MIECIAQANITSAEELCETVQNCKKELKGTQVGKDFKIMGAGKKAILLMSKREKEFISYAEVFNKKGHYGKLLYKVFFEEETKEEESVDVEELSLDLLEQLSQEQLTELVDRLYPKVPNRLDFANCFNKTPDFSMEIESAMDWYKEIKQKDICRAFGLLEAIDIDFNSEKSAWKIRTYGQSATVLNQEKIDIQFVTPRESLDDIKLGEISQKFLLSRTNYGDIFFKRDIDNNVFMVVVCDKVSDIPKW